MKQCIECNRFRIEQEFGNKISETTCIKCKRTHLPKKEHKPVIRKYRKYALKRFYGLTEDDYTSILKSQNYCCAVCGSNDPKARSINFHVDHCTLTVNIRGLLCSKCNTAIGLVNEDNSILDKIKHYLEYKPSTSAEKRYPMPLKI